MKIFNLKSNKSIISKETIAQKEKSFLLQQKTNSLKDFRVKNHEVNNEKLIAVKNLEKKNQVKKIKLSVVGICLKSFSGWSKFFKYQVHLELKKIEKKRGDKEIESTSTKGEKPFKNKSLNNQYQEQTKKEIFFKLLNGYATDRENKLKKNNFYKKSVTVKADQSLTRNINLNLYLQNMYFINDKLFFTQSLASTHIPLNSSSKKNYLKTSSFLTFFFIKSIFLIHFSKKNFFFFFMKSLKNIIKKVIFSLWSAQLFSKQFSLKRETQCFIEERYVFSKFFFAGLAFCNISSVGFSPKQIFSGQFRLFLGAEKPSLFFKNNVLNISLLYSIFINKKTEEKKLKYFFSSIFAEKIKTSKLFFSLIVQNSGKIFSFLKNTEEGYLKNIGNFIRFCSVVRSKDFSGIQIKITKNDFGSFLTIKRILYFLKKNSSTYFFSSVFLKNFLGAVDFEDSSVFLKRKKSIAFFNQKMKAFVWKRGTFQLRKFIQLRKTNKKKKHCFSGLLQSKRSSSLSLLYLLKRIEQKVNVEENATVKEKLKGFYKFLYFLLKNKMHRNRTLSNIFLSTVKRRELKGKVNTDAYSFFKHILQDQLHKNSKEFSNKKFLLKFYLNLYVSLGKEGFNTFGSFGNTKKKYIRKNQAELNFFALEGIKGKIQSTKFSKKKLNNNFIFSSNFVRKFQTFKISAFRFLKNNRLCFRIGQRKIKQVEGQSNIQNTKVKVGDFQKVFSIKMKAKRRWSFFIKKFRKEKQKGTRTFKNNLNLKKIVAKNAYLPFNSQKELLTVFLKHKVSLFYINALSLTRFGYIGANSSNKYIQNIEREMINKFKYIAIYIQDLVRIGFISLFFKKATFLANFIAFQLEKLPKNRKETKFIRFIIKLVKISAAQRKEMIGLRVKFKGRVNRWRRTKDIVGTRGVLFNYTYSTRIEYGSSKAITRKGALGISIWLAYKPIFKEELSNAILNYQKYSKILRWNSLSRYINRFSLDK